MSGWVSELVSEVMVAGVGGRVCVLACMCVCVCVHTHAHGEDRYRSMCTCM